MTVLIMLFFLSFIDKGQELLFFSQNRSFFLNRFFILVNYLGEPYFYILAAIVFTLKKDLYKVISIITLGTSILFLTQLLKNYFSKYRPSIFFSEIIASPELFEQVPGIELISSYTSSFPSGHTSAAFALYSLLAFYTKNTVFKTIWIIPAIFAGLARIYLGQHFLEDVLAGTVLGIIIAFTIFLLYSTIKPEKQ